MKAYVYGANGAEITDVAEPSPKGAQVLVRVRACGLNRADLGMTKGHAHGSAGGLGTVLGMEWAGEVVELGPDARRLQPGDRVMGSGGAAFAEYTLADHGRLFRIPANANMNFEEAATLPIAITTMHNAVVTIGGLQPGQSVLIQGASSGVGLMAMQIARFKGARCVIGSSTNAIRRERLKEFGADLAIDSSDPNWVKQVLDAARRINYIGVTFRTRSIEEIRDIFSEARRDLWPAVEARQLQLPIDKVFAFDDIGKAFERMEANQHLGKIVVRF
jgi:NADPH2:quinone reductase